MTFVKQFNEQLKMMLLFHRIAFDNSLADWDDFPEHLRNAPREDILKLGASLLLRYFASGPVWN